MNKRNRKKYQPSKVYKDLSKEKSSIHKTILNNGLTIISEHIPNAESFALGVMIKSGSNHDLKGKEGLAHFIEHACFRHTQKRNARQIASQFESVGAYTNAYTTKEYTIFYVRALTKHFRRSLNTLSDIILNPVFVHKEIERERQIIIEEIHSYDDDPEEHIFDIADHYLFKNSSLAHPITGTQESVSNILLKDLEDYHRAYFSPKNMIISFSGNLSNNYVNEKIENIYKNIMNYDGFSQIVKPKPHIPQQIIQKRPITQTHILLAKQGEPITSPERYAISVVNALLGDGMSSRLYQGIRERKGLAYSVFSSLQGYRDTTAIQIYAATDKRKGSQLRNSIFNELKRLGTKGINKTELKRSKEQLKSGVIMELEDMSTRMQNHAKSAFYFNSLEDIKSLINRIDSIDLDEAMSIVEKYYNESGWSEIILEPEE